jgi:peptidoglycan/LPS O-acetylase OafA/YrhL
MRRGKTRTLVGMDEPRSPLEWTFDAAAAIGLFLILIIGNVVWWDSPPFEYFWTFVWDGAGLMLFIGGLAGSRWCKQARLSKLINRAQPGTDNAKR